MDIDKLQSANVPSCALISKRSQPASYSLPCVTLVQSGEPGRGVLCNKVLVLVGKTSIWKGADHRLALSIVFWKEKKKTVKNTDTQTHLSLPDKTHTAPGRPLLFTAVSCPFLAHKSQRYEKKVRNTRKKYKWVKVSACVCMCVCWYVKEPVWIVCTLYQKCQCNRCIAALLWWAKEMRFHSYSGWV